MKTVTRKNDGISIYIFNDEMSLNVLTDKIIVGNPPELIIADCNANNTIVYENVTPPSDWSGWKYIFDGSVWSQNPNWHLIMTFNA